MAIQKGPGVYYHCQIGRLAMESQKAKHRED